MAAPHRPPPEPLQTDDMRVVVVGTSLWVGVLVVLLVRGVTTSDLASRWVWVCIAGVFLGTVGMRQVTRRKRISGHDEKRDATTT